VFRDFEDIAYKEEIPMDWWSWIVATHDSKRAVFKLETVLYFPLFFLLNILIMLTLTIVIAAITLVERKTLALVQRRVGPNQTGYRGRLQFIADAFKLLNKPTSVLKDVNKLYFIF